MGNNNIILGITLISPLLTACDVPTSSDALDFRASSSSVSVQPELYAGNGDIEVHDGDDDDLPDEIIWDVVGGTVSVQVMPGVFYARIGIDGNELQRLDMPIGPTCTVVPSSHPSNDVYMMLNDSGEVIFTLWGAYAFEGKVALPAEPDLGADAALRDRVAFSFDRAHIFAGMPTIESMLATASEEIEYASPERRLLLAALVGGECGS